MKRTQIMALALSGILTFSAVSPVLAADIPESVVGAAAAEADSAACVQGGTDQASEAQEAKDRGSKDQDAPDQDVPEQSVPGQGTPDQNVPDQNAADQSAAVQNGEDKRAPPAGDTASQAADAADTADNSGQNGVNAGAQASGSLVSDEMIQQMSDNLTALLQQVLDKFRAMDDEQKAVIEKINGRPVNVEAEIASLKAKVAFATLKGLISSADDDEANRILMNHDEYIVGKVDSWNNLLENAKTVVSDYNQYLQDGIVNATKQLQNILILDHALFTEEFIAKVQVYYDQIIKLKPGAQSGEEIVDFIDEVHDYIKDHSKYLNKTVLEDGKRAAAAFAAFVNSAPDPSVGDTTFNYGNGVMMTYGDVADYVGKYADYLLKHLNYTELSDYYHNYYLNLVNAYTGVSDAILKSAAVEAADAVYVGYTGKEKDAYETALQKYYEIFAAKNYTALPDAVKVLGNAAKAYSQAAEAYMKAKWKTQIPALKDQLTAIQSDISMYGEFYNTAYPAEVDEVLRQLQSTDIDNMTARQIKDLLENAESVLSKRASSYSQKLLDTVTNAGSLAAGANVWWSFLPDQMKGNAPYAEAIRMTNQLTETLDAVNGVYDIGRLAAAYDTFARDFALTDGSIQTAAKAVAQYVLENAQSVYEKESKNFHTDRFLKALGDAIGQLKASIASWDYINAMEAAAVVKMAEIRLVNDKPQQKVEKAKQQKIAPKEGKRSAIRTGDTTDAAQAGMLAILSLTVAAGVLGIRRRR